MMALMAPTQVHNNQPDVTVRQLFSLDNPEEKDEILRAHLVQAASMCDVFGLYNHKVSCLEAGAKFLVSLKCYTLRELVADDDLFEDTSPTWGVDKEAEARSAIAFL